MFNTFYKKMVRKNANHKRIKKGLYSGFYVITEEGEIFITNGGFGDGNNKKQDIPFIKIDNANFGNVGGDLFQSNNQSSSSKEINTNTETKKLLL
jgi:hypothetical protein